MGTRSTVAERKGDSWEGRYVHWDGYPTGVGVALKSAYDVLGSAAALRDLLIHNEPVGWSMLAGERVDFSLPPCWHDVGADMPERHGPMSYSARGETGAQTISASDSPSDIAWAYILDDDGVEVLQGYETPMRTVTKVRWDLSPEEFAAAMKTAENGSDDTSTDTARATIVGGTLWFRLVDTDTEVRAKDLSVDELAGWLDMAACDSPAGKTIVDIVGGLWLPGAYGNEPCIVIVYTDGTVSFYNLPVDHDD